MQMRQQTVGPFHSSQFLPLLFIPLCLTIVLKTGHSDFGEELASSIRQTAQPAANRQLAIRKHHWTQVFSKTPTDS